MIPGLTAGIAGLASAGIPATMRGINRAVVLATGQTAEGPDGIDWEAVARLGQPVVLYMAVRTIGGIAERLMAGGMDGATPAAVVSEATTARQVVIVTVLSSLAAEIGRAGLATPAMIVIGGIVAMRDALGG